MVRNGKPPGNDADHHDGECQQAKMGTPRSGLYGVARLPMFGTEGLVIMQGADSARQPGRAATAETQVQPSDSDAGTHSPAAEVQSDTRQDSDAFTKRPAHDDEILLLPISYESC